MPWRPALLVAVGLAVYANSLRGPFIFDDSHVIVDNALLRHPLQSWQAISLGVRPVVAWTLAANYALGGLDVRGYHLVNVLIHVLAGVVLYGLVRRTLLLPQYRARYGEAAPGLALAAALLWLVHPLQTEAVTYVTQRAECLMGLCYLLTLYLTLRGATADRGRAAWYAAAVLACLLGMGSKEVMVTAPLAVLLYDRAFLSPSWAEVFRRRWPLYAGLAATWPLLTVPALRALGFDSGTRGGGLGLQGLTPLTYALSQPGVLVHYLRLSVWPYPLCLDYGWPVARTAVAIAAPALVILALVGTAAWAWWRHPGLGFLGLCFFLVLAPTSSILPIRDLAVEHRMYLSLAAEAVLIVLAGHAALRVLRRRPAGGAVGWPAVCLAAVPVVVLGLLTVRRNEDYRSAVAIWADVVAHRPDNPRGHHGLGVALMKEGKYAQAVGELSRSLELLPGAPQVHFNLAYALAQAGQRDAAVEHYAEAVHISPEYADAQVNLANLLAQEGKFAEAARHYGEALRVTPDDPTTRYNLGLALAEEGKVPEAVEQYEAALRLRPDFAEAHTDLAAALLRLGDHAAAATQARAALALNPGDAEACTNLGTALALKGNWPDAVACFQRAVRLQPAAGRYACGLAHALAESGQAQAARAWYDRGVRQDPGWPGFARQTAWSLATAPDGRGAALAVYLAREAVEATARRQPEFLDTLAAAYAAAGRFDEAVAAAREALALARQERPELAGPVERRLRLYEARKPFREAVPVTPPPGHAG
jgi:tetratricopeptide (TPR) repeat protein